jgi:hypothetical protein
MSSIRSGEPRGARDWRCIALSKSHEDPILQKVGVFRSRPSEAVGGARIRPAATTPDDGIAKGSAEIRRPSSVQRRSGGAAWPGRRGSGRRT